LVLGIADVHRANEAAHPALRLGHRTQQKACKQARYRRPNT
jgi:hypothetical protein